MSRVVTALASLFVVGGLTACCCPCWIDPGLPIVNNAPPPAGDPIPNLVDPPEILDIKVEPTTTYDKDARFAFLDLSTKGNIGRLEGNFYGDNHLGEVKPGVQLMTDVPF